MRVLLVASLASACSAPKTAAPPPPPRPAPALEALGPRASAPAPAPAEEPALSPSSTASAVPPAPATEAPDPATKDAAQGAGPAGSGATDAAQPDALGWVAGTPVTAEELVVEWSDVSAKEVWLLLDRVVATRLALAESARLSVRLEPEEVEARAGETRKRLEQEVAKKAPGTTLEQYITRELGFDPERYLDRLRKATIRQMLVERAVRSNSLQNETVAVRLIVVPGDAEMQVVQEALQAGADFATVAREHSVDDTASSGGLVPFVVQQEHSPLARLAFQTPVGQLAGPLPTADHVFLIRVEERRAPLAGDWLTIQDEVEASLREHPVADSEFLHWKLAMEDRYPIDMRPLFELLGAKK